MVDAYIRFGVVKDIDRTSRGISSIINSFDSDCYLTIRLEKLLKKYRLIHPPIFLSFSSINSDALFANMFVSLFAFTKWKKRYNSNDINPNENIRFKKSHVSPWLIPLFRTISLSKGMVEIGQRCVDSASKRPIYFSIIEILLRTGL